LTETGKEIRKKYAKLKQAGKGIRQLGWWTSASVMVKLKLKCDTQACYRRAQTLKHPNIQIFKHLGVLDQS
jgi:hypothetical protein